MPFYITHTDGTSLVTVEDGTVNNNQTNITLIGKNFPTYGQYLNQNLVTMLENSKSASSPDPALLGQLWYDSANKQLKIYREGSTTNNWQKIAVTTESTTAPTDPRYGDLWWDSSTSQLKLYDTDVATWQVIGPLTTNSGRLSVAGNNKFELYIGGNPYFTVDDLGGVNLPNNPLLYGYNHTGASNITGSGVWKAVEVLDRANNYSQSTGVFTVTTSGYYQCQVHVSTIVGTTNGLITLSWNRNSASSNVVARSNFYDSVMAGEIIQMVCNGVMYAAEGDTISLAYTVESDATLAISYQNAGYSIQLVG
jgi:hypothetical protein